MHRERDDKAHPEARAETRPATEWLARRVAPDILVIATERAATATGCGHYMASGADTPSRQRPLQTICRMPRISVMRASRTAASSTRNWCAL